MLIAIASDHAGFALKEALKQRLAQSGHEVKDFGTHSEERCDYPDFAGPAAAMVDSDDADFGVLVCGSGIGMCIAANRYPNVRAAVLKDEFDAEMSRRHNDTNVACFGGRQIATDRAEALLDLFLATPFDGGRHEARVDKLSRLP